MAIFTVGNPGRLRQRLVIQRQQENLNKRFGEPLEVWSDYRTVYGELKPLRGAEYYAARQLNAENEVNLILRYAVAKDITVKDRIKRETANGARYFQIVSIINLMERNEVLQLTIKEMV